MKDLLKAQLITGLVYLKRPKEQAFSLQKKKKKMT